jgi:hypothetical protein
MSDSRRRVVAVAIGVFALLSAAAGDAQLRPKVRVLTNSTSVVPPECAEGTVAPPPRVEVAAPAPVVSAPPGLSTALRIVQQAAERNDYDAFRDALGAARASISGYVSGGERDAAQDVLAIDRDLEQVWDFAQTNRTGAFYGEENGALMEIARRYGAPAPLRIGGQTLYPTHELRSIVTREASKRLARIGIHVTSGSARPRTMMVETTPVKPRRAPSTTIVEAQPATPRPRTHKHRSTPRPATRSASPTQVAAAAPPATPHKPAATHSASHAKKPVASQTQVAVAPPLATPHKPAATHSASPAKKPVAPPTQVAAAAPATPQKPEATHSVLPAKKPAAPPTQVAAAAPPSATTIAPPPAPVSRPVTATTATVAPVTATTPPPSPISTATAPPRPAAETGTASTETSTSGTDAFSTTAVTTDTTVTTGSAPAPRPATSGRSNLALRIFVVLIAIGLLVALFRASS